MSPAAGAEGASHSRRRAHPPGSGPRAHRVSLSDARSGGRGVSAGPLGRNLPPPLARPGLGQVRRAPRVALASTGLQSGACSERQPHLVTRSAAATVRVSLADRSRAPANLAAAARRSPVRVRASAARSCSPSTRSCPRAGGARGRESFKKPVSPEVLSRDGI